MFNHYQDKKIFGMTASPVWNPKDPEASIATLEKNLDSVVIGIKDHLDELHRSIPRPTEVHLHISTLDWVEHAFLPRL